MNINRLLLTLTFASVLTACSIFRGPAVITGEPSPVPVNTVTETASPVPPTSTATSTTVPTSTTTPTPVYPEEGYGPDNFPSDVNPLTGLMVADPDILDKRPVAIKVNIVPRTSTRPPWGLAAADIVYEFYQNDGYTRFHAIYYGKEASLVGPIRSARFPDASLVPMYKSIFAYGSADARINSRLLNSEFGNRLVLEGGGQSLCPATDDEPLCRYDPNGFDFLLGGTSEIRAFAEAEGVNNSRQDLEGMSFQLQPPAGGEPATEITSRYSVDSYNRWEYDSASGKYLRLQDNVYANDIDEEFTPLTDRETGEQVSTDNVVVLMTGHSYFNRPPSEIVEIQLTGNGTAYTFRDGQVYEVQWNIPTQNDVLYLTNPDGSEFPFKPGNTWIEVIGNFSEVSQPEDGAWRFNFIFS
ncbi:MAG TPA: DUF3048 C-terminal domain-containing protein [Anaerolineales bacterium]|nr:DUF3048 C-terminal domain-containing protein [Anaerolineales bacterium]